MIRKLVRLGITLFTGLAGLSLGHFITTSLLVVTANEFRITLLVFPGIAAALIGYTIAPRLIEWSLQMLAWIEGQLQKMPIQELLGGAIGLIIGLIIATLFGNSFSQIPIIGPYIPIVASLALGYLGMSVGAKKKEDLLSVFSLFKFGSKEKATKSDFKPKHKVLDTSVIIDGRIADICKSGFIEGPLVIPNFILEELRHIADSSDLLKRNRKSR